MPIPQILVEIFEDIDYDRPEYTDRDRCAVYGYAKALYDMKQIDVDQLDQTRIKLGLSATEVDDLKV